MTHIGQTPIQARVISRDELLRLQHMYHTPATVKPPDQFYAAVIQQVYTQGGFSGLSFVIEDGEK